MPSFKHSGAEVSAARLEPLVANAQSFCRKSEDRFKVWPTNRDRPSFNEVMAAVPPVYHSSLAHAGERMVDAHQFFSKQARQWLDAEGPEALEARANAIEWTVRDLLQMVVIDLGPDENAQEIFETLNARGAQLTAADLIKNFIFQRLAESSADVELTYEQYWRDFESAFWETETSVGRAPIARSAIFLNHWLIAQTGEEVVARHVFSRFKRFAIDANIPMMTLLPSIAKASRVYRKFIEAANQSTGTIDRTGLFAYRTGALESEVIKPVLLHLLDPERQAIPKDQLNKALVALESWMVRRMLVRATTKGYNRLAADLITYLSALPDRSSIGDAVELFLVRQTLPNFSHINENRLIYRVYRRLSTIATDITVSHFVAGLSWKSGHFVESGLIFPQNESHFKSANGDC